MTEYECRDCEDSGYQWDTIIPCKRCKRGKENQHQEDLHELEYLKRRMKLVKNKIKEYENSYTNCS